ncbi:MAG: RNA ligase family protein [Kofleriaceae bacterium]
MRFRTYPKIGGASASAGGTWVATEKLHGANFVVGVDDKVWFGKRKQWVGPDEPFFGWQLIAAELGDRCRALASQTGAAQTVCYGELYGGGYPHRDVAALPGMSPVQTGVWYAPELRWALLDVLVARGDDDDGELLGFSEVAPLAMAAGIETAPVLGRGKKGELQAIVVAAPTAVPERLGLPPLAGNLREGYVLKPDRRYPASARPILKRKLPDFDDARFEEGPGWQPGHLSFEQLRVWAVRLVNPARVASARSKVGADPAAIIEEIVLDVAADLETVFAAAWRALGEREASVLEVIRRAAVDAVRR